MSVVTLLNQCPIPIPDIIFSAILYNALRAITIDQQTLESWLATTPQAPHSRCIIHYLLRVNLTYLYGSRESYLLRVRKHNRISIHEHRMTKLILEACHSGKRIHFHDTEFQVDSLGEYVI